MSVLPAPAPVLTGVDEVLVAMTRDVVGSSIGVSTGPLDRPKDTTARLNWFLYRVTPAPALINMEPPQTGWTTRRGRPPLALTLHYLLSADPGELNATGNEVPPAHNALTAVMMLLHERAVLGPDTLITSSPAKTVSQVVANAFDGLVEPLRITMDTVPLETITGLWASGLKSLRLSVAYQVSLVIVPSPVPFSPGPPVQERRIAVSPSAGPRIAGVAPVAASFGDQISVAVTGLGGQVTVTLSRAAGDPDDPTDGRPDPATTRSTGPWALTAHPTAAGLTVMLPNAELVPGRRALDVTNLASGLPAGTAGAGLTVAPAVRGAGAPLQPGQQATLTVAHVLPEGRVAFGGVAVPYTRINPTTVTVMVPAGVAAFAGRRIPVSVESGTVTGRPLLLAVAP
ncbi:DUF4255 domain-containing protein [Micromonospora sp. DR5-3]|uniref:DUF4255 domain-containing protein n=1 Tax=unclassified Micromonospora TaxID=2617518 RepID=UPI0011D44476|nr:MULTISPECIES: DUF4255 domain-containing protein [unclassified Micromonospora]MCW3819210.1 DUF4255 domain-containing protein [Micromonospora sp. DR5-3]TYC20740.1 DUF4255 domain-containing protein [Micromonospora sp. MP36]